MKKEIQGSVAIAILACAACSPKGGESPQVRAPVAAASAPQRPATEAPAPASAPQEPATGAPAPQEPAAEAPAPQEPATLTDVNLVATDMGGGVESLSNGYIEPGYTGWRLIDGQVDPTWKVPETWTWNDTSWVKYPFEAVFSFFERQAALVGGLTVVLPEVSAAELPAEQSAAPKDVEVWTSMDSAAGRFVKVASATLEAKPGEQTITFPATEARFVKLRVLSGMSPKELEIAEVRVLEAVRPGYTPLFVREPMVKVWKGSPREAAQRGLDWLQAAAVYWPRTSQLNCFGCHVQAQALMGQAVALRQGYRVDMQALRQLETMIRDKEAPDGTWPGGPPLSVAAFGSMGLAYAAEATRKSSDPQLLKAADNLLATQETDGAMGVDNEQPPIIQGQFMTTANALVAVEWAAAHAQDPKYRQAAERALAWISDHQPETTQDRAFKIIALMRYGTPDQRRTAWSVAEELAAQQQPDGGWKEVAAIDGSNAFATGQALYAFKQAGVSVQGEMFRRGVDFLMKGQVSEPTPDNGSWKAMHTQSKHHSAFAPTMWAVIGLAGAYGTDPMSALQIVKQGDKSAGRNLEIVLDVSGSMNTKLGESTRWQTALDVLKEVVATLPDDLNVGLRVYGHRYPSKSAQTCQDTELVVPIGKLDRDRIVNAGAKLKPRGETPLVRSVLKTIDDLKSVGGGSVILITDGEESCHGDAKAAARQIKASDVNVTLNIVGFTLTGKAAEAELSTFAGSTGGHYYGAQDGKQLSRAVMMAALQRLPYDVDDASGKVVASGETSELSRELPPGSYRVRIEALGQKLEEPFTIVPDQTTTLGLAVDGDRFVIRH